MPRTAATEMPSVFDYADYRLFLRDGYEVRHARDRGFSHRLISKAVQSSSSSWFTDILKTRQNLTPFQLVQLLPLFGLAGRAADYFEALVQYNQASSLEERNHFFRKLNGYRHPETKVVEQDHFEYYSRWYYAAIRELLFFHPFKGDYAGLAKKLDPAIKPLEAKEAIELLLRLGFLRKDAQGTLRPLENTLRKDSKFKSLYALNYLRSNIQLGLRALETLPKEERNVTAMTLSYSEPYWTKACEEIENLKTRLVQLMDEDIHPQKVFQMNLQFFPLTR